MSKKCNCETSHHITLILIVLLFGMIYGSQIKNKSIENTSIKAKEILTYYENGNIKEKYYVLVDESGNISKNTDGDEIRHGQYIQFFANGEKEIEQEYFKGKNTGKYIEWCENGYKYKKIIYNTQKNEIIKIIWNCNDNIQEKYLYKNNRRIKTIKFDSNGNPIKYPSVGILPYPIFGTIYWGYPTALNSRFGIDLKLPSQNEHIKAYPFYLFGFAEPGINGLKGGLGISKELDKYPKKIALQVSLHYSWYEIDWNKFTHIPRRNTYIGSELEICGWVFSVKAGPYFKIRGDSDDTFFFSTEFGLNFKELFSALFMNE